MKRGSWISEELDRRAGLSISPRMGLRGRKLTDAGPRLDICGIGFMVVNGVPIAGDPRNIDLRNIEESFGHGRLRRRRFGMDMTWVTDRIAVGGGIWTADNMAAVSRAGITHILDMQIEFDDTPLAESHGIVVCWNPIDDDFEPKPADVFLRGVGFALEALRDDSTKLFVHCAAGVHRAPMMTLALLGVMGWTVEDAMDLIQARRPAADFAEVYVRSVEEFLNGRT